MGKAKKKTNKAKDNDNEEVYCVEKILDERIQDGKVEYLVKWRDLPMAESTWEPEQNLDTALLAMIKDLKSRDDNDSEYSENNERQTDSDESEDGNLCSDTADQSKGSDESAEESAEAISNEGNSDNNYRYGLDNGFIPENILGATCEKGETFFLVQWKGSTTGEFVRAKYLNTRFPQVVIRYYESITVWEE